MTRPTTVLVGFALIAIVGGLALGTAGVDAHENTPHSHADTPTVHVTAAAETTTAPDRATVRLAVIDTAETAHRARAQIAQDAATMRGALRDAGVEDDQVQTTYYDISAVHQERKNGTEIVGYRAAHGFEVDVTTGADELGERTGSLVDTAVQNGANQVDGVEFTLGEDTRRSMRQQAIELAMDNARDDANTIATEGELTITGVRRCRLPTSASVPTSSLGRGRLPRLQTPSSRLARCASRPPSQ
jgi:uncharacterized protein YggE